MPDEFVAIGRPERAVTLVFVVVLVFDLNANQIEEIQQNVISRVNSSGGREFRPYFAGSAGAGFSGAVVAGGNLPRMIHELVALSGRKESNLPNAQQAASTTMTSSVM